MLKVYDLACDKNKVRKHAIRVRSKKVQKKMEKRFDEYYEMLEKAMDLTNSCILADNPGALPQPELEKSKYLVACYLSLGQPIQELIDEHTNAGKVFEGYFLGEIANEMIMSLSMDMHRKLKSDMDFEGHVLTKRFTPGTCTMELKYQVELKEMIEGRSELCIDMTDRMQLLPSKSMIHCYGADEFNEVTDVDLGCAHCDNVACYYNRNKG